MRSCLRRTVWNSSFVNAKTLGDGLDTRGSLRKPNVLIAERKTDSAVVVASSRHGTCDNHVAAQSHHHDSSTASREVNDLIAERSATLHQHDVIVPTQDEAVTDHQVIRCSVMRTPTPGPR